MANNKFNLIEFCSGVGGFGKGFSEYANVIAGVEFDKNASGVFARHHPKAQLFSDLEKVKAEDLPWDADDLVLLAGTPCQAFSQAGLRKSLQDARGNLALVFIRLVNAIDTLRYSIGKEGAIVVWENVQGVFSSKGNAFGCFLGGLCGTSAPIPYNEERGWDHSGLVVGERRAGAWRLLDARHFGVPQRRKRVFVVASPNSRKWLAPDTLIPIKKSMQGNPEKGKKNGEEVRSYDGESFKGTGVDVYNGSITGDTTCTLTSATGIANASGPKVLSWNGDHTPKISEGIMQTLRASQGGEGFGVAGEFGIRKVSIKECMRLMSWDDDYCDIREELELEGNIWKRSGKFIKQSRTQIYKQAGNGVVSNCSKWIAKNLHENYFQKKI